MNMHFSNERPVICRPGEYGGLESIAGPPLPYNSPRHLHEELEIALNRGRWWQLRLRGEAYQVSPREIVLTAPEVPHSVASLERGSGEYVGLRVHPDFLRAAVVEITERPTAMLYFGEVTVDDPRFYATLLAFHTALRGEGDVRLERDAMLQDIVLHLMHCAVDAASVGTPGDERGAMRRAKAYLQENYREDVSLRELADHVGLSPFYLSRAFCTKFGLPPHAYLMQVRVAQAKKRLAQGVTAVEVAFQTGFSSQSHLNSSFKRVVGITPGQYAQDCRG